MCIRDRIYLGADQDVTLTHVADTGILLNSTRQLQFNDASQYINAPSATVLDINATDEIELNATLADINANLDVSGTYTGGGLMTTGGNIVIPDAGNIGSASDTDAIAIASTGAVTFSKQVKWAKGGDLASATTLTIDTDGNYFDVTGTTTITAFSTIGTGTIIKLHFDGALILTHHVTNLILPGAENITTAPGDEAEFVEYASADWRCTSYTKATSLEHPDAVILNSTDGSSNAGDNVILDASASGVDVGSALIYEVATEDHLLNKFSMEKNALNSWWNKINEWKKIDCLSFEQKGDAIKPQYAIKRLYELTKNINTIITTEVGQHQMWAAQYYKFEEPNKWLSLIHI